MKKGELRKLIREVIKEQMAPLKGDRPDNCPPGAICGTGSQPCWNSLNFDIPFPYSPSPAQTEMVAMACYQEMFSGGASPTGPFPNLNDYTVSCCQNACMSAYNTSCGNIGPMISGTGGQGGGASMNRWSCVNNACVGPTYPQGGTSYGSEQECIASGCGVAGVPSAARKNRIIKKIEPAKNRRG